ncbi:hypothetical protein LUZ63_017024 [Rhynchospora breviuscula]|uniref:DET1- and DDB1-associated protein 1 domain-containing protein n=1 Tax=Rhynchospora breviuscula TaxID=2022672 RepID=A0A9Q0HFD9_9POAL|nr:hypothetical protein LUZ63_017024 [Rhynchospora breviuscula]
MVTESTSGPASGTRRAVANLAGASEFLPGLPSRGNFTVGFNSNMDAKTHMCLRDTSPPEGQIIKTDVTNILIRSLQLKRSDTIEQTTKGKRTPTRLLESKVPSKRLNTGASSSKQGEMYRCFYKLFTTAPVFATPKILEDMLISLKH